MSRLFLYLLLKIDDIVGFCTVILVLSFIILVSYAGVNLVWWNDQDDEEALKRVKRAPKYFILMFCLALMLVVTPSTKQLTILYFAPKVIDSLNNNGSKLVSIGDKTVNLGESFLDYLQNKMNVIDKQVEDLKGDQGKKE